MPSTKDDTSTSNGGNVTTTDDATANGGSTNTNPTTKDGGGGGGGLPLKPKPKPKIIRVLTVLAYMLSVSMAAILLSIYYVFMWDGKPHLGARRSYNYEMINDSTMVDQSMISSRIVDSYNDGGSYESFGNFGGLERKDDRHNGTMAKLSEQLLLTTDGVQNETDYTYRTKMSSSSSMKLPMNVMNGCSESQWIMSRTNSVMSTETSVKLAGEEAKDRLYEPKHKKKLVRVLTVIAYVFFVSLAAIMLSLYYVFLWNGDQPKLSSKFAGAASAAALQRQQQEFEQQMQQLRQEQLKCDNVAAGVQSQSSYVTSTNEEQLLDEDIISSIIPSTSTTTTEENTTWSDYDLSSQELLDYGQQESTFMKKLMYNKYPVRRR